MAASPTDSQQQKVAGILLKNFGESSIESVILHLKTVHTSANLPRQKLDFFYLTWFTKLERAIAELPPETEAYWNLCAAAGNLLRTISLQAAERRTDMFTAMQANQLAFKFAKSPELWVPLKKDHDQFSAQAQSAQSAQQQLLALKKFFKIVAVGFFLLVVTAVIGIIVNPKKNSISDVQSDLRKAGALSQPDPNASTVAPPWSVTPASNSVVEPAIAPPEPPPAPAPEPPADPAPAVSPDLAPNENPAPAAANPFLIPASRTNEMAHDLEMINAQRVRLKRLTKETDQAHSDALNDAAAASTESSDREARFRLKELELEKETAKLNAMIASYNVKLKAYAR